jgi:hypothetical protein
LIELPLDLLELWLEPSWAKPEPLDLREQNPEEEYAYPEDDESGGGRRVLSYKDPSRYENDSRGRQDDLARSVHRWSTLRLRLDWDYESRQALSAPEAIRAEKALEGGKVVALPHAAGEDAYEMEETPDVSWTARELLQELGVQERPDGTYGVEALRQVQRIVRKAELLDELNERASPGDRRFRS